ncbi:MAG: hypothetical protein V4594_17845 [Bacteroidota bacterium]
MKVDLTRLERIDFLIRTKSTGTPREFAARLGLSIAAWYNYRDEMQDWGAKIAYSKSRRTYYYIETGLFKIGFLKELGD